MNAFRLLLSIALGTFLGVVGASRGNLGRSNLLKSSSKPKLGLSSKGDVVITSDEVSLGTEFEGSAVKKKQMG